MKPVKRDKGKKKWSDKKKEHIPCAVALKISSNIAEYNKPVGWMIGEYCFVQFVDRLFDIHDWVMPILKPDAALIRPDPTTLAKVKSDPNCCICKEPLAEVRAHLDHDHRTGKALVKLLLLERYRFNDLIKIEISAFHKKIYEQKSKHFIILGFAHPECNMERRHETTYSSFFTVYAGKFKHQSNIDK